MKFGILTSGGDCAGLNAVIRAIGLYLLKNVNNAEIVGIPEGYAGLIRGESYPLTREDLEGLLTLGGTILRTRRTPFKRMTVPEEGGTRLSKMVANYKKMGLDCLFTLGGAGTHKTAALLSAEGCNVIGLPKTIDNDIYGTDVTFGFQTAVEAAVDCIDRITTTAASHGRTMLVELMGNKAGWLALHAGLAAGALSGVVTGLLAAQAPARRAAKVSPMEAASGNSGTVPAVRRTGRLLFGKAEWTLGIRHAAASRKNWFLMTASFALSIVLFLCFSVGLDFARQLVPTLRPWQPDLSLNGYANALLLEPELLEEIREIPQVEGVYGVSYLGQVPAASSRAGVSAVNLMAYTEGLLESMEGSAVEGDLSAICGDSGQAATIQSQDNPLQAGDTLQIGGEEITIACAVSSGLYSDSCKIVIRLSSGSRVAMLLFL